jgi:hypothetical protein
MTGSPPNLDGIGLDELKRLLLEALAKIAALTEKNAALHAEIARLKGLKGPPAFKPSSLIAPALSSLSFQFPVRGNVCRVQGSLRGRRKAAA